MLNKYNDVLPDEAIIELCLRLFEIKVNVVYPGHRVEPSTFKNSGHQPAMCSLSFLIVGKLRLFCLRTLCLLNSHGTPPYNAAPYVKSRRDHSSGKVATLSLPFGSTILIPSGLSAS